MLTSSDNFHWFFFVPLLLIHQRALRSHYKDIYSPYQFLNPLSSRLFTISIRTAVCSSSADVFFVLVSAGFEPVTRGATLKASFFFPAFIDNYVKRRFEAIIRASTLPTQNKTTFILLLCDCLPQVIASCKNLFLTGPWHENISFVRSLSFVFLHISFFVQIHLFPVL